MTKFKIYQLDPSKHPDVAFLSYRNWSIAGHEGVVFTYYDLVYEAERNVGDLEDIFIVFNLERPEDFKGHSLSVSDIVEILESDVIEPGRYYCDSIGWKKLEEVQNETA